MNQPTIHDIIHALEQIEEAFGEGQIIEKIELDKATEDEPAMITVYTADAVFPIKLEDWE